MSRSPASLKIGLHLVNVNIRDIEDDSGYIVALGRRAAAEAINQANVDVAEQEKKGQIGVATRQRDQRVAVAAASAEAEIGEAEADRNRRARSAQLNTEAVEAESAANAQRPSISPTSAWPKSRRATARSLRRAMPTARFAWRKWRRKRRRRRAEREGAP